MEVWALKGFAVAAGLSEPKPVLRFNNPTPARTETKSMCVEGGEEEL